MKRKHSESAAARRARSLLLAGCAAVASMSVLAQDASAPITELTVIDLEQIGDPPTGPYAVVVEHDPGLPTHTIYRPAELAVERHPVLRSEEHTSELQSRENLVCRLLLEKKNTI